jgi:hypothetical protein
MTIIASSIIAHRSNVITVVCRAIIHHSSCHLILMPSSISIIHARCSCSPCHHAMTPRAMAMGHESRTYHMLIAHASCTHVLNAACSMQYSQVLYQVYRTVEHPSGGEFRRDISLDIDSRDKSKDPARGYCR